MRRIEELSKKLEKAPGKRTDKPLPPDGKGSKVEVLKANGITTQQASLYERIAAIRRVLNFHREEVQTQNQLHRVEVVFATHHHRTRIHRLCDRQRPDLYALLHRGGMSRGFFVGIHTMKMPIP
jgi:hypothetical protein